MNDQLPEITIRADDAVFWMDERGRWCNEHGPFENPKIIERFHRAIRRDAHGYFVTQERDGFREKVYFHYITTPLLAVDARGKPPRMLLLNTGDTIPIDPGALHIRDDTLFMSRGEELIRFSERAMVKLSACLEDTGDGLFFRQDGNRSRIVESTG